jgi:ribonucleoside-diphosphate reductase alpha chain
VSHGLQYGVPLEAFVQTFTNRRFEPAGMTDDPDLRIATSLVDYVFRKRHNEYLPSPSARRSACSPPASACSRRCRASRSSQSSTSGPGFAQLPLEDQAPSAAQATRSLRLWCRQAAALRRDGAVPVCATSCSGPAAVTCPSCGATGCS